MKTVYFVNWWESERGRGKAFIARCYYKTREEAERDIKGTSKMYSTDSGYAPDYYQFPGFDGIVISEVSDEEYAKLF